MQKKMTVDQLTSVVIDELHRLNYAQSTIWKYHRFFEQIRKFAQEEGTQKFSKELGERYLFAQYGPADKQNRRDSQAVKAVRALECFQANGCLEKHFRPPQEEYPANFAETLSTWGEYLRRRNLSPGTVDLHQRALRYFFDYLISVNIGNLENLDGETIAGYIECLTRFQKGTVRSRLYSLRSFLRFAAESGLHKQPLEKHVPDLVCPRGERLASTWTAEETEKILAAVDRGNPTGKRDYAILLLAARLGIRSSDITALKLDDIKWERDSIEFVQAKTRKPIQLPLSSEIGMAIVDYLKHGRPCSESQFLFFRHWAPYDPLLTIYSIVEKHIRLSGVEIGERKCGAHSLRHSLVSRLLENSIPYPVVSSILGHSSANATKSYTHLDIEQLRICALDPEQVMLYA